MNKRIASFEHNVGALQPILGANLERIIRDGIVDRAPTSKIADRIYESSRNPDLTWMIWHL